MLHHNTSRISCWDAWSAFPPVAVWTVSSH